MSVLQTNLHFLRLPLLILLLTGASRGPADIPGGCIRFPAVAAGHGDHISDLGQLDGQENRGAVRTSGGVLLAEKIGQRCCLESFGLS